MFGVYAVFRGVDLLPIVCGNDSKLEVMSREAFRDYFANPGRRDAEDDHAFVRGNIYDAVIADKVAVKMDDIVIDDALVAIPVPVDIECVDPEPRLDGRSPPVTVTKVTPVFKGGVAKLMLGGQWTRKVMPLPPGVERSVGTYWHGRAVGVVSWMQDEKGVAGYGMIIQARPEQSVRVSAEPWVVRDESDGMQLLRDVAELGYNVLSGYTRPYDAWRVHKT